MQKCSVKGSVLGTSGRVAFDLKGFSFDPKTAGNIGMPYHLTGSVLAKKLLAALILVAAVIVPSLFREDAKVEQAPASGADAAHHRHVPVKPEWLREKANDRRYETGQYLPGTSPPEATVLLIGDSLSIPIGRVMESNYEVGSSSTRFIRIGMESSGLARPDFFDWKRQLDDAVRNAKPDLVLIMLGTNDNKDLRIADSAVGFRSKAWEAEYSRRVARLVEIAGGISNRHARVYWVGAPVMKDAKLNDDVKYINSQTKKVCEEMAHCTFVSMWDLLKGEEGGFEFSLVSESGERISIRAQDGIHLQLRGAEILVRHLEEVMGRVRTN